MYAQIQKPRSKLLDVNSHEQKSQSTTEDHTLLRGYEVDETATAAAEAVVDTYRDIL
jgi:hypothetical protein